MQADSFSQPSTGLGDEVIKALRGRLGTPTRNSEPKLEQETRTRADGTDSVATGLDSSPHRSDAAPQRLGAILRVPGGSIQTRKSKPEKSPCCYCDLVFVPSSWSSPEHDLMAIYS